VRIAVLSDLHLGSRTRVDLARLPAARTAIAEHVRGCDEVVLLGDAIELRDRPLEVALAAAAPFLEELGAALPSGRVVLVPGNHDHEVVRAIRRRTPERPWLDTAEEVRPGRRDPAGAIRDRLGVDLVVAYPGWRPRDDVWATHGHYVDAHSDAPTLECVLSAVTALARRRPAARARGVADYEAVLAPAYACYFGIAQRSRLHGLADAAKALVRRVETRLGTRAADGDPHGADERAPRLRLRGDRVGTAPGEVRRPGLLPIGLVLERLRVEADHVLFGHTHRTGPLPGDPAAAWHRRDGTALWNTGSWVYERAYVGSDGPRSPYWPGTVLMLDGAGGPRVRRLLETIPEERD
jgi:predicted phosphodiesterase